LFFNLLWSPSHFTTQFSRSHLFKEIVHIKSKNNILIAQSNNIKTQEVIKTENYQHKNYEYKIININTNSYEMWLIHGHEVKTMKTKKLKNKI
jgi:hypothetical protein